MKYGFDFLDVPNWQTLVGGIATDAGNERFVADANAVFATPKKYYRMEISKP